MKIFFQKNKKWLIPVAIVLVTAIVVGVLAASTNVISKISNSNIGGFRERNDDNLVNVDSYESLDGKKINGVKFDVDDNGVITLNGEATDKVYQLLDTISITESSGNTNASGAEFHYVSGCLDGSLETYFLSDGDCRWYQLNSKMVYLHRCVPDGSTVDLSIYLEIEEGTELKDVKIYPAVFTDPDATFYAK